MRYTQLNEDFIDNIGSEEISISSDATGDKNFLSAGFRIHMQLEHEYTGNELNKIVRHLIRCLQTNRFVSAYSEPFYEYSNEHTYSIYNYASFMSFSIKQKFRNTRHIAEFFHSLRSNFKDYFKPCYILIVSPNPDILVTKLRYVDDYIELLNNPLLIKGS